MHDFSPSPFAAFSEAFEAHVNARMEARAMEQEPRDYLGGSRLGVDCLRALGYEYHHTPKDPDLEFKGHILRIFDMGHDGETRMAEYLRTAGFELLTHRPDGHQFGFGVAPDPQTGKSRIAGHIDGVIVNGPADFGSGPPALDCWHVKYPALWENKGLNDKGWKECLAKGVMRAKPVYYAQMQTYMAYLGLSDNPGLFTATNRNTGQLYAELVPFDPAAAQAATDRGVKVIQSMVPEELPRIARESTDFRCKFCDYAARCWAVLPSEPPAAQAPSWLRPA